jgi:excisionase family DNA binding protein
VSDAFTIALPPELLEQVVDAVAARVLERLESQLSPGRAWPEWMNVETAANYLDVSPERLRKLQARREVPFHQEAPGCRVLYGRSDLDQWMNSFRHPAQ